MSEDDPIGLCLAGRISPEVALARLVLAGVAVDEIARRLEHAASARPGGGSRHTAVARLLAERGEDLDRMRRMVAESGLDHAPAADAPNTALARSRETFDRAVAHSPEASVATYSLGDPAILSAATAELVAWLDAEGLLGPARDVLDLGCGIGRVAAALALCCRSVLGLDLSPGMIAEARRRHVLSNLRFAVTEGSDLAALPDAAFDLVLAVDSFPYLVQAGREVAERHVADTARVLRAGGALAILNLSYRADMAADRADAARWAAGCGFRLSRDGVAPFALWDGVAFVLLRSKR